MDSTAIYHGTLITLLDGYMAYNPKARFTARGPEHADPTWRLTVSDPEGDAHEPSPRPSPRRSAS